MVGRWTIGVVISLRLRGAQQEMTFMFLLPKVLFFRRPICPRQGFSIIGRSFWRPWGVSAAFAWTLGCILAPRAAINLSVELAKHWLLKLVRPVYLPYWEVAAGFCPQALHSLSDMKCFSSGIWGGKRLCNNSIRFRNSLLYGPWEVVFQAHCRAGDWQLALLLM